MRRLSLVLVLALALGGCGDDDGGSGTVDSGVRDSGALDSGAPTDASPGEDAAPEPTDASTEDASTSDASTEDAGVDAGPGCLPRVPVNHRPVGSVCDDVRDPGPVIEGGRGSCSRDEDCTDGWNGRCIPMGRTITCSYDECFTDDDCGEGLACACGSGTGANACVPANGCSTDADCDSGFCASTLGACGTLQGPVAFQCRTCEDTCVDDADCEAEQPGAYCAFDATLGHWSCQTALCAG